MFYWLLDVELDGETLRLAEVALDVPRDDGTVLHYVAAVVVDPVTETVSLLSPDVTMPEAQLRIWLDRLAPLALFRASGELSRWVDTGTYERRRRVVAGHFQSPEGGSLKEGVATTLSADPWLDPTMVISATQKVDSTTLLHASTVVDAGQNLPYPLVIGHPGRTATGWVPAMVALWADQTAFGPVIGSDAANGYTNITFIVAGHACSATRVRVSSDTPGDDFIARLLNTTDSVGQPIAVLPFFASSSADPVQMYYDSVPGDYTFRDTEGSDYVYGMGKDSHAMAYNVDSSQPPIYVSFENTANASSGGLQVDGTVIRQAGDVLAYMLSLSAARVDRSRMSEAFVALSPYLIDTVVPARVSAWGWIVNVLLPLIPVSLAGGADGVFAIPVAINATLADAEGRIDTRRTSIGRVSALKWDSSRLVRTVTVNHTYNVQSDTYVRAVTYAGRLAVQADLTGTVLEAATLSLAESWDRPGEDLVINTAAVYDDSTAGLIASMLARIRGLPLGTVSYSVAEKHFSHLRRGSVVYLYDAEMGLDLPAQVVEVTTGEGDGSLTLGLLLLLDPMRDTSLL